MSHHFSRVGFYEKKDTKRARAAVWAQSMRSRARTQQKAWRVYTDGVIPRAFFFSSKSCKVLFVFVVCLPTTLHWTSCFFVCFGRYWTQRAQRRRFTPTLPLFTERRRRRRGPSDMAASPSFPVWTPLTARSRLRSSRMDWSVKNVHLYINDIFLCNFFFVSVSRRCSWNFFFLFVFWVWGISSDQKERSDCTPSVWL